MQTLTISILSWACVAASLAGTLLVTRRRPEGFYLWSVSNAGWIAINWHAGQTAQAALFAAYLALSIYGMWEWRRDRVGR